MIIIRDGRPALSTAGDNAGLLRARLRPISPVWSVVHDLDLKPTHLSITFPYIDSTHIYTFIFVAAARLLMQFSDPQKKNTVYRQVEYLGREPS